MTEPKSIDRGERSAQTDCSDGDQVLLLTRDTVESALKDTGIKRDLIIDALYNLSFYVGDLNPNNSSATSRKTKQEATP